MMDKNLLRALILDNKHFFDEVLLMIRSGRNVTLRAKGWSMLPLVWDERDAITLAPLTEASFAVGRIVLAQLGDGRYVVHRIAAIKEARYTLRGDGNPYQYEYCHHDQICAELTSVRRNDREIVLGSATWQAYRRLWPSNGFLRRSLLFIYRRIAVNPYIRRRG